MKSKIIILILLMATGVYAQMWGPPVNWSAPWIRVRTINAAPGEFTVDVKGGVPARELDSLGFATIGSGTFYNGYQSFTGGADWDSAGRFYQTYMMYPPTTIDEQMVSPSDRRMFFKQYTYYCGCADTPQSDTVYTVDAFGYWRNLGWNPQNNFDFKGYYLGQLKAHKCMAAPCPIGSPGPIIPKNYICFTDSMYVPLPDDAIPCGQSRIYILANVYGCDSVYAVLSIPGHDPERVRLERISQYSDIFTGSYINSVSLGLKSFNQVTLEADAYPPPAANELVKGDKTNVALPILVRPSNNTINIDHDDMKFTSNITVGIKFLNDGTNRSINPASLLDSIGYRLKTRWEARSVNPQEDSSKYIYRRRFPPDSSYRWCRTFGVLDSLCQVTFKKDSLAVVGGDLTIEMAGAFLPIENLPPHFNCDSDSINFLGAKVPRYHIKIDEDPSNAEFVAELGTDIMRAIAWTEGACTETYGVHHVIYPKYNNYWSDNTKCPCENRTSTATGTMQMLRKTWERTFNGSKYNPTAGFDTCRWDSLSWNWKINIFNGNFIYFKDNFYYINDDPEQSNWDSLCTECEESDSTSKHPNKEDLAVYGYTWGAPAMGKVDTLNWDTKVKNDVYVKRVRGNKHAKPWPH